MIQSRLYYRRIEIKYLSLGAGLLALLVVLSNLQIFDMYQDSVGVLIQYFIRWGIVGIFFSAMIANSTVVVSVPYSFLVFTVVLLDQNISNALTLGLAAGIGAGIGRVISYSIARRMASQMRSLPDSALYRFVRRLFERNSKHVSLFLFLGAFSILPDEIVITPVALSDHSVRKAALPIMAGKLLHTLTMIGIIMLLGSGGISKRSHPIIILASVLLTVLIIFYQIDKAKFKKLIATASY